MAKRPLKRIGCVLLVGGIVNCGGTVEKQNAVGITDPGHGGFSGGPVGVPPQGGAVMGGGGPIGIGGFVGTQPGVPGAGAGGSYPGVPPGGESFGGGWVGAGGEPNGGSPPEPEGGAGGEGGSPEPPVVGVPPLGGQGGDNF